MSVLLGYGDSAFKIQGSCTSGSVDPQAVSGLGSNLDGKPDLVAANNDDSTVSVLLGKGDGFFIAHVDYATGSNPLF